MSRIPHSAKTLIRQVQDHYGRNPDSRAGLNTGTPVGDPDGFNVIRTIKFDRTSSKWLATVLPVMDDPRIADYEEKGGHVYIRFSHRTVADQRRDFPLDEASLVASRGE